MQSAPPPGWHPDPSGAPQQRYWDGQQWTEHTQPNQAADPSKIQRQVQQHANVAPIQGGGGTLFTEPVLVVNQKAKLIELTNEYSVFNQQGTQIASVAQIGQSGLRKALRFVSSVDQFLTTRLEVRDRNGPVLVLTRPAKIVKSRIQVHRASGEPVGEIVQANVFGKIRFDYVVNGQAIGGIQAENWRAWNFAIVDHTGGEVARITKTWEGLAKTMFTTADNYVVQIHRPLADPLASLVIASALSVDTALKQDSRGFG